MIVLEFLWLYNYETNYDPKELNNLENFNNITFPFLLLYFLA